MSEAANGSLGWGRVRRTRCAIAGAGLLAAALLSVPSHAGAAPPGAGAFRANDYGDGSVFNIVPPGQNGAITAIDATNFLTNGTRPAHQYDQNDMYASLVYKAPNLTASDILDYYKDASFGVRGADVERTYAPSCGVVLAPSANIPALRRRHHRPRPVRDSPRLRGRPGGADVRPRLHHRGRPAVPGRRPPPRRALGSLQLRRRRQRPSGRGHLLQRPLRLRGRAPGPVRPRRRSLRRRRSPDPEGLPELRRRYEPVDRRDEGGSDKARRALRGDQSSARPRAVEGDRRDRHRRPGRGDLRQGRRRASSARHRAPGRKSALRASAGGGSGRTSAPPTTPRRRGPCTASASPTGAAEGQARGRRDARPRVGPATSGSRRRQPALRRRARVRRGAASWVARAKGRGLERAARLRRASPRAGTRSRCSARRPATSPPAPDGAGHPRARRPRGPGDRRAGRRLRRHQPLRPTRPRARLLLVGDLGGPGHHRHLRRQALQARRRNADARLARTTCSTASACRWTCSTHTNSWMPNVADQTPPGSETLPPTGPRRAS